MPDALAALGRGAAETGDAGWAQATAVFAISRVAATALLNFDVMRVLGNAPRDTRPRWPAMRGGTGRRGTTVRRRQTAHYRVTNASGEERSGWSLWTFAHVRRDTAGDERSEAVGQLDLIEGDRLRRDCSAHAAGRACAALVQRAVRKVGLAFVRMSGVHLVQAGVSVTGRIDGVMIVRDSMGVIVRARAAGDHRRCSHALQRQSDCQQEHRGEASETQHRRSLGD